MTTHAEKTKAGIKKAKDKGVEFGANGKTLAAKNRTDADKFAESIRPYLLTFVTSMGGKKSGAVINTKGCVRAKWIADQLNKLGVKPARGTKWHPNTVRRIVARLGPSFVAEFSEARKQAMKAMHLKANTGDFALVEEIYEKQ